MIETVTLDDQRITSDEPSTARRTRARRRPAKQQPANESLRPQGAQRRRQSGPNPDSEPTIADDEQPDRFRHFDRDG